MRKFFVDSNRVLVLIPARYDSSRYPGKPLVSLLGKSMIQRVYENCMGISQLIEDQYKNRLQKLDLQVYVVTDDQRIEDHVNSFQGQVIRVDDEVVSGTERIFLALKRNFTHEKVDFIINVQGDEPLVSSQDIMELINFHLNSPWDVATMVKEIDCFQILG